MFPYCSSCKAKKNLCGLGYCPIIRNVKQAVPAIRRITGIEETDTPPGIFVGSYGYPSVLAGPTALYQRDLFDYSREKRTMNMEEIISTNSNVYRTATSVNVRTPESSISQYILESASSTRHFEIEFNASHFSSRRMEDGDFFETPVGSTAMVSGLRVTGNPKIPQIVDYLHEDPYLKASEAILKLYEKGYKPEYLQNIVAGGIVGVEKNRKMVPTRWSITATDDMIFKQLKREVTQYNWIPEIRVFNNTLLGNQFQVILLPGPFSFEMLEQWNRGSLWGQGSVAIDYESVRGRTTYASSITGAYYAARLSAVQYLKAIRRQASVVVIRNIGPDYYSPLGVWVIRSGVEESFSNQIEKFDTTEDLLRDTEFIIKETGVKSRILKEQRTQRRLVDFNE
jgi:Uncharacterized conserved protein